MDETPTIADRILSGRIPRRRLSADCVNRPVPLKRTAFLTQRQIRYNRSTGSPCRLYRSRMRPKKPRPPTFWPSHISRYRAAVGSGSSTMARNSSTRGAKLSATTNRSARSWRAA